MLLSRARIFLGRGLLFCLFIVSQTYAAPPTTFTSNGSGGGDWVNNSSWTGSPGLGCATTGNDTYDIQFGDSIYTNCATLSFGGSVTLIIRNGGVLYIGGSGGITGSVDLTIETGGKLYVVGDLNLGGSSVVDNDGEMSVGGDITGPGKTFDCDGTNGTGVISISGSGCSACTAGTGTTCNENTSPLPVQLLNFDVNLHESEGFLFNWATVEEINNDIFSIEHSSDGKNFKGIAEIEGAGNSSEIINYTHHYPQNVYGQSYFRLKQIDFDGSYTYSEVVAVNRQMPEIVVYPNPSEGVFEILSEQLDGDVTISLHDASGTEVYNVNESFDHITKFEVDLQHQVRAGAYWLQVVTSDRILTERLIIY